MLRASQLSNWTNSHGKLNCFYFVPSIKKYSISAGEVNRFVMEDARKGIKNGCMWKEKLQCCGIDTEVWEREK